MSFAPFGMDPSSSASREPPPRPRATTPRFGAFRGCRVRRSAMGLFDRVRSWLKSEPDGKAEASSQQEDTTKPEPARDQVKTKPAARVFDRLANVGLAGGPTVDEAIAMLRQARGTVNEAEAVAQALSALGQRSIPEPVRVACADILA